jgi:hypothetical protein
MPVTIEQKPLYDVLPIGQQVIFAVSQDTIVATKYKVKFVAEVHVSTHSIVPNTTNTLIGTYKTTPNNAGVGIFDLRPILETFVSPDNLGSITGNGSRYKTSDVSHPIHLIDKYSRNTNSVRYFAVRFKVEYAEDPNGSVGLPNNDTDSDQYTMFNGVLQYDDVLTLENSNYGYNLDATNFYPLPSQAKFLSNAPSTQYARLTDYGTFPFLNFVPFGDRVASMTLTYYWDGGSSTETIDQNWTNGGVTTYGAYTPNFLLYFGGFPANLQNTSTVFAAAIVSGLTHYTIRSNDDLGALGETYTVNIICPNERGYEGIRLTWLNQWGTWDYYTFNMKSTRSIQTNRTSYTQLGGTWNESTFKIADYKGGKKNFRVNSSEKIKLNTDFVTEAEGVWFEELINSSEVYIVNGFSTDVYNTITNKYIDPVVLTTSSYVKKTIANDKVMQYTIEVEKSKMKRTQSV